MKSLLTRTISALIAAGLLLALYFYWGNFGLKLLIFTIVLIGTRELNRVLFNKNPLFLGGRIVFSLFCVLIYILSCWRPIYSGLIYCFFYVGFSIFIISFHRKYTDVSQIFLTIGKAALGFVYIGLLPSFAQYLLDMPKGIFWFLSLLVVVFAGDIGAYMVGVRVGKRKIIPMISPKKSVEGALGGMFFSLIAGLLCSLWFSHINTLAFGVLCLATSVAAQYGDFFESLIKRVADVKDSGHLMPGHGGILDRIDGVLFACPVFLLGAIVLEKLI